MNINNLKTAALLALLTALLVFVGRVLGGTSGMVVAFLFALGMNFFSYWFSDQIALRMNGARELAPQEDPELYAMIRQIANAAQMPMPRVYVVNSPSPNAFATGRDPEHAAIAVTTGIRQILSPYELAGVLAHELAHVRNRDTLISTVVATFAGAISFVAQMAQWALLLGAGGRDRDNGNALGGLFAILVAPILAVLIQLAVSRSREFEADATGARIMGDPLSLASALGKLEAGTARIPLAAEPATAHLFIVNPFGRLNFANLFSTHPPIQERIARLREMAAGRIA